MDIKKIIARQISLFYTLSGDETEILGRLTDKAIKKASKSLSAFNSKYFIDDINPLNSIHWCNFLYWLSRFAYEEGNRELADKAYYLNKTLNSVELYYEVKLPEHWSCEHPLGSVLGRAKYGDRFFFYQGCTVGGSHKDGRINYPTIGDDVRMYSGSKVLGRSIIGNNVILSANAYVINEMIPDGVIVFGQSPNLSLKWHGDN